MIFNTIAQIVAILVIYLIVMWYAHMQTERWGLPTFLQFKPFICKTCLSFWTLIAAYTTTLLIGMTYTAIGGYILAILNAIAMKIDQKNKTIDVNNYHLDNEENETH